MKADAQSQRIIALERPHPALWTYYMICAVLTGPGILTLREVFSASR